MNLRSEKKLVLATGNQKKLVELQAILQDAGVEILTLDDFPSLPEVEEDGQTMAENAVKKARIVCEFTGLPTLADDSGLEVDALGGRPGVYSARFAGEPADDVRNNAKLLNLMDGVPDEKRAARFRCVIALAVPEGGVRTATGTVEGRIGHGPRGTGGFGYDPLFTPEGYDQTFAELPGTIKNRISHRSRALTAIRPAILSVWGDEA